MPPVAEFELRVLFTVHRLGDDAYAVAVHAELERRTRRKASLGAVYITLDRLTRKGLLDSRLGEATAERGGRAKRYYRLSRIGLSSVREEWRIMQRLADGLGVLPDRS
jgi:DNA-binding PadR family transcriptional regulator